MSLIIGLSDTFYGVCCHEEDNDDERIAINRVQTGRKVSHDSFFHHSIERLFLIRHVQVVEGCPENVLEIVPDVKQVALEAIHLSGVGHFLWCRYCRGGGRVVAAALRRHFTDVRGWGTEARHYTFHTDPFTAFNVEEDIDHLGMD